MKCSMLGQKRDDKILGNGMQRKGIITGSSKRPDDRFCGEYSHSGQRAAKEYGFARLSHRVRVKVEGGREVKRENTA